MITLYRKLKVPDPEAVTARNTLKDYALRRLNRTEEFLIDADDEVIASAIGYVYNPSEHFYMAIVDGKTSGTEEAFSVKYDAQIEVETDDDPVASDILSVLKGRYGHGDKVRSVTRKVVWGIIFDEGETDIYNKADEMARTLFANPTFQKYEVVV